MKIPNGIITISSIEAFNKLVNVYKENLILVDFFTDWCGPCKAFLPIYKKAQERYYDKGVIFTRINSEEFPEVSVQFNIQGVPTLLLIRNKRGLEKHTGALTGRQLMNLIDRHLN